MHFPDSPTVREARDQFLAHNGFVLDSYEDKWVRFDWGPFPVVFPNPNNRRRTIPLHDLHHIAAGYGTDVRGEAEVAAWELAAGCHDKWVAWVLNAIAFATGLLVAPKRTWAAFLLGRNSRSLYAGEFEESMLDWTMLELRSRLRNVSQLQKGAAESRVGAFAIA